MASVTLLPELKQKITDLKKSQKRIEDNLKRAKSNLDETIDNSIIGVMTDDDIIKNEQYKEFFIRETGNITIDATKKKEWIESLSKTDKIALLVEYSIDNEIEKGENNYQKKLIIAQEAKDATKKAIAIQATAIIKSFNDLLIENQKAIDELEKKIQIKEDKVTEMDRDLARLSMDIKDKNGTKLVNTDEAVKKNKSRRKDLQDEINSMKTELTELKNQQSEYKKQIEKAISDIEESLKSEGIYVGSYASYQKEEEKKQTSQGTVGSSANGNSVDQRKPKDIAKAMMVDFANLSPKQINELISNGGYEDLLNMTKDLGPINRLKLRKSLENRLDDLKGNLKLEYDGNTVEIDKKDLLNLKNIDNNKFNAIIEAMNNYTDNFETMHVYERREAEKIMEFLKLSILHTEASTNKSGRFFRGFSKSSTRITEIGNTLREFAKAKEKREDKKWDKNQELRNLLKVKTPIPSTSTKKVVDRSGTKPINKER